MKQHITKEMIKISVGLFLAANIVACGAATELASGKTPAASTDSKGNAAAVASSVFGSAASASLSAKKILIVKSADSSGDTCKEVLSGNPNGPDDIQTTAYVVPGAYGSLNDLLHVDADDSCALSADSTEENPDTTGPDGGGRVASFEIAKDVEGTCLDHDGSEVKIAMKTGSAGAWRNTDTYSPEVWGSFTIAYGDEGTFAIDCSFKLGANEEILSADCSDDSGVTVVQETNTNCTLKTDSQQQPSEPVHTDASNESHE